MLCAFAAPDGWILDQYLLDLPGRVEFQVALLADYPSNVELYPKWPAWLREHRRLCLSRGVPAIQSLTRPVR